jgi:hypothetical protein
MLSVPQHGAERVKDKCKSPLNHEGALLRAGGGGLGGGRRANCRADLRQQHLEVERLL